MKKRWVSIWFPHLQETVSLDKLCQKAKRYTPVTALDEPDGLLLDVTGCAHLFGGEVRLLSRIQSDFTALGLCVQTAMAPNPRAAWAFSHFKPGSRIEDEDLKRALSPLPIAALRLPEKAEGKLEDLSIEVISQLLALPRPQLLKRLGLEALDLLDQAMGLQLSLVQSVAEEKSWRLKEEFVEPLRYSEMLIEALAWVLKNLCSLLQKESLGATQIQVTLFHLDRQKSLCVIGTAMPTHNPMHLEKLLRLKLEKINLGLGIEVIELEALQVAPIQAQQLGISEQDEMVAKDFAEWRDLISNRLGPKSLFYLSPRESHLPEQAIIKSDVFESASLTKAPRPLRFLHPPEPIFVTAILPDNPPAQIRWRGRVFRVTKADGPERIEPEWWSQDKSGLARDYYRIENAEGLRLWVYRQGMPPQWYVQGVFA